MYLKVGVAAADEVARAIQELHVRPNSLARSPLYCSGLARSHEDRCIGTATCAGARSNSKITVFYFKSLQER